MFIYITTTTVPSFYQLQIKYDITYSEVNLTVAIPSLGLALGPLFWSSLSDIYGRRIIFIAGTNIALLATIGTVFSKTYSIYMLSRALQGFGASPGGPWVWQL
jgi:MFS family permease